MGRATRWLWNLWGGSEKKKEPISYSSHGGEERMEKKRWSFRRSRDSSGDVVLGQNAATAAAIEAAWFKSLYAVNEREQSKHAIAVAAATANAAVAAAQAAVVAARLTTPGRGATFSFPIEQLAAVKIQTAFRGHLIDVCRPRLRSSRRAIPSVVDPVDYFSSPISCPVPARVSTPSRRNSQENDWCINGEKCRISATAQGTPRYTNSPGKVGVTQARSVYDAEGVFRRYVSESSSPSYMTNTKSSKAKRRPQSGAPKHLPEAAGMRKRQPLGDYNNSCFQAQVDLNKAEQGKEAGREGYFLQMKR
ncbi:hypothetical protein BHE74_00037375 [Ensete ventricosum]|nr:hypothetical protein GW17_00005802 [Ensete ventricosum]RWW55944.1 hypothetical protein BHE74_00037375 [Ensete ventricosum]RZS09410.1 hypothetical protein BHM03_00040482 [Ensete ventricosum]